MDAEPVNVEDVENEDHAWHHELDGSMTSR
jgi:hypothetical protein